MKEQPMADLRSVSSPRRILSRHESMKEQPMADLRSVSSPRRILSRHESMKEQSMADLCSVSSPRRILSLRRRRTTGYFLDPDDKTSGFGMSGEHGPKPSEVYGFVGSISTAVATVIFLVWAYVPEPWLHSIGIDYYPSRYWALAMPAFVIVAIISAMGLYIGLNFVVTPPPTSLNTIFDEFSREPSSSAPAVEGDELPIEPIADIGIHQINDLMFNNVK